MLDAEIINHLICLNLELGPPVTFGRILNWFISSLKENPFLDNENGGTKKKAVR